MRDEFGFELDEGRAGEPYDRDYPFDDGRCSYEDLDANAGVCSRCGRSFWDEPDATLAVERHYERRDR